MATLDLSLVTQTLRNLLHANVRRLLNGALPNELLVTTTPPDLVDAGTQTLNLHLYAVMEDAHFKNAIGLPNAVPPIAGQPMALRLYYILTPHLTVADAFDAESQQRIMGMAMKTFHDIPVIADGLQITPTLIEGPLDIMEPALQNDDNRIEISLRPIPPEETVTFWAAEDQRTARLSAFYEVRTVLLEPEQPQSATGRVFDLGLSVRAVSTARITGSRARLDFVMPAITGLGDQQITTTPARATLRAAALAGRPRVRILGQNLTGSDRREVRFRAFAWEDAEGLDADLNPDWDLRITPSEISFVPQATLDVDDGAGGVVTRDIRPGGHEVSLRVILRRETPGATLETPVDAGRTVIGLAPHLDGVSGPDGAGRFTLDIDPVVDLTAPAADITLTIGGEIYAGIGALPAPPGDRGLYSAAASSITFGPLFDAAIPAAHPVQLRVGGVEAQPFWVEV